MMTKIIPQKTRFLVNGLKEFSSNDHIEVSHLSSQTRIGVINSQFKLT